MIYDLLVIGDGLAAKSFLFEYFYSKKSNDIICQNFNIAQVSSENLAPSCSLRSTATVSLNGIKLGVSPLGDLLFHSFYSFKDFYDKNKPDGVENIQQIIAGSTDEQISKLEKRYAKIEAIENSLIKSRMIGAKLDSFVVSPNLFLSWFDTYLDKHEITRFSNFVISINKDEGGVYHCLCHDGSLIKAKKLIICTGAFMQILKKFYDEINVFPHSQVVSGSYMVAPFKYENSFYITIDGYNLVYRKLDGILLFGSSSQKGNFTISNFKDLSLIYDLFVKSLNVSLPSFNDFSTVTGLRNKGSKRMPIFGFLDDEKSIGVINGLYKNGYSLPLYLSKLLLKQMINP